MRRAEQRRGRVRAARPREPGTAWGRRVALVVPPEARAHLRAAAREGLLALASFMEAALRAVEGSARVTRQRIAVKGKR